MTRLPTPQTAAVAELDVDDFVILFGNVKRPIVRFEGFEDGTIVIVYRDGDTEKSLRALRPDDVIPAIRLADYGSASPSPATPDPGNTERAPDSAADADREPATAIPPATVRALTVAMLLELYRQHGQMTDAELYDRIRDFRIDAFEPIEQAGDVVKLRRELAADGRISLAGTVFDAVAGVDLQVWQIAGGHVALTIEEAYDPEPEL